MLPKRNQRTPKGEGSNMRLARKHTNVIMTQENHVHDVAKHHIPKTRVQPKTLSATTAKEKDISVHSAKPNQFLVRISEDTAFLDTLTDQSAVSWQAQLELNGKATV